LRDAADAERIALLARELGRAVAPGTRMYLTGGATAVLEGWRDSTVDVDVRFEPDSDDALSRIRDLKEELSLNVELASPLDFLPPLPEWEERSRFRFREGNLEVFDFDPYSQVLSKLQRGQVSALRYRFPMSSAHQASSASKDAAAQAEAIRRQRLREDAQRPMSVNLAETIALSHQLLQFAGAARRG